jgi:hypothetical protein
LAGEPPLAAAQRKMKTFFYSRGQQTLCMACKRRVESNGDRFVHLVIYGHNIHAAEPDSTLAGDSSDPWFVEKLKMMEAAE